MPKRKKIDIKKKVMVKIKKGRVKMKPKMYFILGTLVLFVAIFSTMLLLGFSFSILSFSLRGIHPLMKFMRLRYIFQIIPWWIPLLLILGIFLSVILLKKFDFSYKKNFVLILILFFFSLFLMGYLLDFFGANRFLLRKPSVERFYRKRIIEEIYIPTPKPGDPFRKFRFK